MPELKPYEAMGYLHEVQGPVVVIRCERMPPLRRALCARLGGDEIMFEVHQHLDEHHVRAIPLHSTAGLFCFFPI